MTIKKYRIRLNGKPYLTSKTVDTEVSNGCIYSSINSAFFDNELFKKPIILRKIELLNNRGRVIYFRIFEKNQRIHMDKTRSINITLTLNIYK
jgi:hypothetical protein